MNLNVCKHVWIDQKDLWKGSRLYRPHPQIHKTKINVLGKPEKDVLE